MPFAIHITFILLASVLFAALIYMTLYHIIHNFDGESTPSSFPAVSKNLRYRQSSRVINPKRAADIMTIGNLAPLAEAVLIRGRAFNIVIFGIFGVMVS